MVLMKEYLLRFLEIGGAIASYILFHELGHFMFASVLGMEPAFVVTQQVGITGMSLLSVGVEAAACSFP